MCWPLPTGGKRGLSCSRPQWRDGYARPINSRVRKLEAVRDFAIPVADTLDSQLLRVTRHSRDLIAMTSDSETRSAAFKALGQTLLHPRPF
jgi:hypothetical protein